MNPTDLRALCCVAGVMSSMSAGCLQPRARACQTDEECALDAKVGACLEPGYCAYPSEGCPSGLAYGPFAGEGLADQCLASATASGETGDASSGGGTGSSGGGDGPTPAGCRPASEAETLAAWNAGVPGFEVVDVAAGEGIAVAGVGASTVVAHLDDGGRPLWIADAAAGVALEDSRPARVWIDGSGDITVAGTRSLSTTPHRPYVARFDTQGTLRWQTSWVASGQNTLVGAGLDDGGGVTVAGLRDGAPWWGAVDASGTQVRNVVWLAEQEGLLPVRMDATAGGVAALTGPTGDAAAVGLRIMGPSGAVVAEIASVPGLPGSIDRLAAGRGGIVVGGMVAPWLGIAEYDATVRWTTVPEVDTLLDLDVDRSGRPILLGLVDGRAWVARFDLAGEQEFCVALPEITAASAAIAADADDTLIAGIVSAESESLALWRIAP